MNFLVSLLLLAAPVPDDAPNLYDLDVVMVDHTGSKVRLDAFRGQPLLISMFFGTCKAACPMLVGKVRAMQAKLSPRARAATRVLLVTFDPERDTPEALEKLAAKFALDERWVLAQTPPDSVRELAAALGVKYRRLSSGSFEHNSVLTVVDANGALSARIESLDAPPDALLQKLEALVGRPAR